MPCGKDPGESAGIEEAMGSCGRTNFFNPPRSRCYPIDELPNRMVWKEANQDNQAAIT
jgi:hypothetical protein